MKVSVAIADDEPIARAGLRHLLCSFEWVQVIGEAENGPATVALVNTLKPELLFLDIRMPGLLGTEAMRLFEHQPQVVFTTAYAEHAVSAFALGALDYLLKPFGADRLAPTMERVRASLGEPQASPAIDRLSAALAAGPMSRLFVRSGRTIVPVSVSEVSCFKALGDYVVAYTEGGRHTLHLSLARLETRLDPKKFIRAHRTHIVNLDHVQAFKRTSGGQLVAVMANGERLSVSRTMAQQLRAMGV